MRIALGAFLAVLGVGAGLLAYGALSKLWADYQDSPPSTYLEAGLPMLALCIAALTTAAIVLRRDSGS